MNQNARLGKSAEFRGKASQRGYATLFVAVIALLLLTIMTFYFSRVAVMDQRMSGNEVRYKEAFSAAMFGLDTSAIALEGLNPAILPAASFPISPALFPYPVANETQHFQTQMTRVNAAGSIYYTLTSKGWSTDKTGSATVSRQYTLEKPLDIGTTSAPLVVGGVLTMTGGFEVVNNPEGYCIGTYNADPANIDKITDEDFCADPSLDRDPCFGSSQPLSILAKGEVNNPPSAFASCNAKSRYPNDPDPDGNGCKGTENLNTGTFGNTSLAPGGVLDTANKNTDQTNRPGFDIQKNVSDFPDDLFVATFGRSPDALKALIPSTHVIKASECSTAADTEHPDGHLEGDRPDSSAGYWWVEPDGKACKPDGLIGAADSDGNGSIEHDPNDDGNFDDSEIHPVVIIVEESDMDIVAGTKIYGVVFFLDRDKDGNNGLKTAGNATVHGSIMASYDLPSNINGDFVAAYDKRVLCALQNDASSTNTSFLSPIQGSWRDWPDRADWQLP